MLAMVETLKDALKIVEGKVNLPERLKPKNKSGLQKKTGTLRKGPAAFQSAVCGLSSG